MTASVVDRIVEQAETAPARYELAGDALARADHGWLERLITRRVALDDAPAVLEDGGDDIQVVIDFGACRAPRALRHWND